MRVNIIGPYPPPYGGISVHVKRMYQYLKKENVEAEVFSGSNKLTAFKIPFLKGQIIHFHCISKKMRILMGLIPVFHKKTVFTVHGESLHDQLQQSGSITKKLLLHSMKKMNKIICVNPETLNELLLLGLDNSKLIYLPAYINPIEQEKDFISIPDYVWSFIDNSKFLISASGCIRFYNNQDLYGIDMFIELMRKLKSQGCEARLLIVLTDIENLKLMEKSYYNTLRNRIEQYNLQNEIMFYEAVSTEFYPILKKSSLFIRPTNTDGYGISIAEALYYNVPSIASDVCRRPEGALLFKSRDIKDLYNKTVHVINNYDSYREKTKLIEHTNNEEKLLYIYIYI